MADKCSGEEVLVNSTEVSSSHLNVDLEGDPRTRLVLSAADIVGGHKKKATSFQITSVTVQGNRLSNDGGDDSADDLDESHTEEISSDILDCSKATELDNEPTSSDNSNSNVEELSSASKPSIPVSTIGFGVPITIDGQVEGHASVNSTANAQEPMVTSLPDHWHHRFKIVKLANSEPFKRGRWLCMDFTDPPVIHNETKHELTDTHEAAPCSENPGPPTDRHNSVAHVYEIAVSQSCSTASPRPIYGIVVPASTATTVTMVHTVVVPTASDSSKNPQVAASMPLHNAVSQHQSVATTQTVPVSLQQPLLVASQPPTGIPPPKPVVSVPDLSAIRKTEPSSVPSHVSVPQVNIPTTDGVGLRISSIVNPSPLLEVIPDALGTKSVQDGEESESTPAGTNTVAIDNKIEQAMDLVKSHLMFAVREEVDVLKERITELVDQISRLEQENSILKANASSETLSLLGQISAPVQMNQQQPPQPPSSQHSVSTQQTQTTAST